MNNETPEDRTARYLKRSTYEEMNEIYIEVVNGKRKIDFDSDEMFYGMFGWTKKEYWAENRKRKS